MSTKANAGSAYAKLSENNRALIYGKRCRDDSDEEETATSRFARTKPPAKKQRIIIKPRKPAKKPEKKVVIPVIENWRPAGGDVFEKPRKRKKKEESSSCTLGIARIATWRMKNFMEALQTRIEEHAEIEDIVTRELVHGGESVTDIWVEFESEEVAESIKEKFDGEIIHERKLQVKFA